MTQLNWLTLMVIALAWGLVWALLCKGLGVEGLAASTGGMGGGFAFGAGYVLWLRGRR